MNPQEALQRIIDHREIFHDEMVTLMRLIMRGEVSDVMTAAILTGLRVKKETIGEITGAAQVMREFAVKVPTPPGVGLVDIVGTGGDGAHTFNISTAAMFVAAAAGAQIAKHGNRSVSSKSGSADVLEALGADIELTPEQVGQCLNRTGIGFMFAPAHHGAMRHAVGVRRELGLAQHEFALAIVGEPSEWVDPSFAIRAASMARVAGAPIRLLASPRTPRIAKLGASLPLYAWADKRGRKFFNDLFYQSYAGISEDRLICLGEEMFERWLRGKVYGDMVSLMRQSRAEGFKQVLVTGALDTITRPLAAHLEVDDWVANRLEINSVGEATGQLIPPVLAGPEKALWIKRYAKEHNIDLLLDLAKLGEAVLNAKPELDLTTDFVKFYNTRHP